MAAVAGKASASLPELRQELQLLQGPIGRGESCWLIHDPVRHRYFEVSRRAFELLELWRGESIDVFAQLATVRLGRAVAVDDVRELATFIVVNHLSLQPLDEDARSLALQETSAQHGVFWSLVHNYLFFRVPLFRPERILNVTMPIVEPLFSRTAAKVVIGLWLMGIYFTSRQWDLFVGTFLDLLSWQGAVFYGIALIVVKALHELGHAYTATRAGVRVTGMGIAFMVMTPVLYTDVTDAWRLRHRREKLAIDAAGIVVELALAGVALFLWAFLPDGPIRSIVFVTATTSLIMGLVVNLNPLMRFDGYHILADVWRVPNLQARSNALAQWWLRQTLFDLRHPPPEDFSPRQRSLLILYALCVWIYRVLLFLGIALLVYHVFFKLLGFVLFVVEIVWFILLPIGRELKEWWMLRARIVTTRRSLVTAGVATLGLLIVLVPWSGTVVVQGVMLSTQETVLYAPRPGRIVAITLAESQRVEAGQVLMRLAAPDLDEDVRRTRQQIALVRVRLARIAGDDADRANRVVLERELIRHQIQLQGFDEELQKLTVKATHAGMVRDLDPAVKATEWIDPAMAVARVVGGGVAEVKGYISEDDLWRLESGAAASFVAEDPIAVRRVGRVVEVVQTGARAIDHLSLASIYGGAIASDRNAEDEIKPRSGRHLVRVALDGPLTTRATRGMLHIAGKRESIAAAVLRRVLQVLVRESGV